MSHLIFVLFLIQARAEYRAFELVIADSASGQERVVISTLDPKQYRGYHPVKYTEQISYRSTWMCRGNTSSRPICAQPDSKKSSPAPAKPAPSLDQKNKT